MYSDTEPIHLRLLRRDVTVADILPLANVSPNVHRRFASSDTKKMINYGERLCDLLETIFLLVKEDEAGLISIIKPQNYSLLALDDNTHDIHQRYTIFATIADICHPNQIDPEREHFIYSHEFVPSVDTPLTVFRSTSPVRFALVNVNLPIAVSVTDEGDGG